MSLLGNFWAIFGVCLLGICYLFGVFLLQKPVPEQIKLFADIVM